MRKSGKRSRPECPKSTIVDAASLLGRRQFLQFAAAATGVAIAGPATAWQRALAESTPAGSANSNPVSQMAATLGRDLKRIFTFVQREIRYEPYAGVLRGAKGTLLARAGNSVDQALLLSELLRASGTSVQFVTGALDPSSVNSLMATTVLDAEVARQHLIRSFVSDKDLASGVKWVVPNGPNLADRRSKLPDLATLQNALTADATAFSQLATSQVQSSINTITKALAAAGVKLPAAVSGMPSSERAAHTWVQAKQGATWLDLDPTFPQIEAGKAMATPGPAVASLPDKQRHRITFTVIAESLAGGALAQETILEVSAFADELSYSNVFFTHVQSARLAGVNLIGSAFAQGQSYNPVLVIGPNANVGRKPVSIGGGGGAGSFADAFGGGGGEEGLIEGEASAEWLEVRMTPPGGKPVVARRAIFDRVGQAIREGGAVDTAAVPMAEFVDLADGAGAQYLPCRSLRAFFVSNGTVNLKAMIEGLGSDGPPPASLVPGGYDAMRNLLGAALAKTVGCRTFSDSPNIVAWVIEPVPGGYSHGLDIWSRAFGTLGLPGAAPAAPPAMIAGIIPQVIERIALGDRASAGKAPNQGRISVGGIFEAAAAQGVPVRLFDRNLPKDVSYRWEHRTRIKRALDSGLLVVAPARAINVNGKQRLGWWLIDRNTGATVDERDDGRGASGEYVVVPTAGATGNAGLNAAGWSILNTMLMLIAQGSRDPRLPRAIDSLWKALMTMRPPGGG